MVKNCLLITLSGFFILLHSCVNKKVQIVEREKAIKKEQEHLSKNLDSLTGLLIVQGFSKHPDTISLMNQMNSFNEKYNNLTKEYDSLELELKKY